MTTPTDYPDRVRALVADAGPEDWHFDSGYEEIDYYRRQPAVVVRTDIGSSQVASGYDIGQVALMAESKRIARAYLAACEEVERLREIVRAVADGLAECDTYGLDLDALIDALAGDVVLDAAAYTPGSLAAALRLAADRAAGGAA